MSLHPREAVTMVTQVVPTSLDVLTHSAFAEALQGTFPVSFHKRNRKITSCPYPMLTTSGCSCSPLVFHCSGKKPARRTQNKIKTSKSKHTLKKIFMCMGYVCTSMFVAHTGHTGMWKSEDGLVSQSVPGAPCYFFLTPHTWMACELPGSLLPQSPCGNAGMEL